MDKGSKPSKLSFIERMQQELNDYHVQKIQKYEIEKSNDEAFQQ